MYEKYLKKKNQYGMDFNSYNASPDNADAFCEKNRVKIASSSFCICYDLIRFI